MTPAATGASESLNRITAPDRYTALSTIENTPIKYVVLDVVNQAIYWQLQKGGVWEDQENYQFPGSRVITRFGVTGVRVRAATPAAQIPAGGLQAVVNVEAVK